jgi:hypothetical protein
MKRITLCLLLALSPVYAGLFPAPLDKIRNKIEITFTDGQVIEFEVAGQDDGWLIAIPAGKKDPVYINQNSIKFLSEK